MPDRPDLGTPTPLWQADAAVPPALPPLTGDLSADVIVVGSGITGLTTALLLHEAGADVAVVEARTVANGVTGRSTGHLTELVDVGYRTIRKDFGEEGAATVARVTRGAIQEVRRVAGQYGIECELKAMPAYLYADTADDEAGARAVQEEADAAEAAGLRVERLERAPLPFATGPALDVQDQAVFDPYAYTVGVARVLAAAGVPVHEGVRVQGIEPGDHVTLATENGQTLRARRVVLATHTPLGFNPLQTVVFPYRSYVLAVDPAGPPPEGMFFDTSTPYHYTRPAGDGLLVVGGADHKTGQGGADAAPYEEVLDYVRARYPGATVRYRWSSEVFDAADGLPSIGPSPFQEGVLVATGYSGDGLLWGTAAARILSSLARGEEHPDADLFSPTRFKPLVAGPSFLKENLDVAFHFVADRVATDAASVEAVPPGGGALVLVEGRHLAVHRTDDGAVHAFSPVCPHLHCVVRWNGADRTWDCPCHGARYDAATGAVLSGPAMHGLAPEEV